MIRVTKHGAGSDRFGKAFGQERHQFARRRRPVGVLGRRLGDFIRPDRLQFVWLELDRFRPAPGDALWVTDGEGRRRLGPYTAGDAFGGALCHGLLSGWDLPRTVRYGNAAGAIVAGRMMCADDMPTVAEIDEFLAARGTS